MPGAGRRVTAIPANLRYAPNETGPRPGLWSLIVRYRADKPAAATRLETLRPDAEKLARLISPALAAHLLEQDEIAPSASAGEPVRKSLIDPARARASRLANRLTRHVQTEALKTILDTGIDVCCIKGFAAAHTLYPDPDLRTFGDLDLLVRAADRARAINSLTSLGFGFRPLPGKPWGFQSDASLPPLASPDGRCNVDLHIHPDAFPAWVALSTDQVFASAERVNAQGVAFQVPSPAHALALAASNTAKDKFGPFGVRRMIDAFQILDRRADLDWREVERIASTRALGRALRLFLALAGRLGYPFDRAAAGPPPQGLAPLPLGTFSRPLFAAICAAWERLELEPPGAAAALAREALLCWPPEIALRLSLRRLAGLGAHALVGQSRRLSRG